MGIKTREDEIYLFGLLTAFSVIWVIFITPTLEYSNAFISLNPVLQYVSFNLGFIVLTIVMINLPYRFFSGKKTKLVNMLKLGIAGWLMFSFVFDLWQPPYYLSATGGVLITNQQSLPSTAVDAMLTYVWSAVVPANSTFMGFSSLYIFVYFVTPILAVLVMMIMLKPKLFRQAILER